ncbi:bifunctional 2',3'-cyclic-nucleotide 2'-phosphodiesterase/3'-nucleotidase [Ruegeria haliotis]|uniref:bifunctional 2',3'-cyclic-nucleotide 2'-phosphodiesterase/3'-nucleotidase n=1 Tax=Ruegeria haliotis TaxID=2747601 RepID=UPI001F3135AB|nr:bifunctional 2',3'-cyclic-nucleotide 2'-phosphodiesterase/3'-nucleotidase [Ruegeria haliotis]
MKLNKRPSRLGQTQNSSAQIRILATTDLHMNLNSFDYHADKPDPTLGFTRTASLIRAARQQAGDALVLLFDNGDFLQGTPFGEWAALSDERHPILQAFEELSYDTIGLGNHDFGFGLAMIDRAVVQSPCPVVSSNLHRLDAMQGWHDCAILDRTVPVEGADAKIRIGVFSVLPPQIMQWEAHLLQDKVIATDILTTAQKMTERLRTEGCDLIVALAHSGFGQIQAAPDLENAIIPLAAIEGIDAIIAGHTHLTFPGVAHEGWAPVDHTAGLIHGKPVVMPGSAGSHLGVIDLFVDGNPESGWNVSGHNVELRPICSGVDGVTTAEDPDMVRLFASGHIQTRSTVAEPVAHVPKDLHSYFSFCAPDRGLALVAAAQAAALRPFLHGTDLANLPILSAVSPYKCGGRAGPRYYTNVPAGEICLRHIADLHVFPNELRAMLVTGAQLQDWLEMSAGIFNQLAPHVETDLTNAGRAGHNFDVLFGLSYRIDPSQPPRFDSDGRLISPNHKRVESLIFEGHPVQPEQTFVVALNNYRANGGGHFRVATQARPIDLPSMDIKGILRDYLSGELPQDPLEQAPYPFSLRPQPGLHSILRTGPGALKYLSELDMFAPEPLGRDAEGFERIRLAL